MIQCRVCKHQEVEGALFCTECGTGLQPMATQAVTTVGIGSRRIENPASPKQSSQSVLVDNEAMALQVLDGGQIISLADKKEITMGRMSDGQVIVPDVDLTAYRAYEYGVSRLHAVLKKKKNEATIMDLGSSNGTYLDGVRLKPESEYTLYSGSVISLGKLKIQFVFKKNN